MASGFERIVDTTEQPGNRGRTPFVADSGLGHELRTPRRHVVAASRRVVVAGQTIVEVARHVDLDPHRRIRAGGCIGSPRPWRDRSRSG